jgi:hypothetical protein
VLMALPTRIEIEREADVDQSMRAEIENMLKDWVDSVLNDLGNDLKKKT